jgi:tRNA-dihydrouridine synthase
MESYEQLSNFVTQIENAGCENFVIHARKAWLKGLSPKENRIATLMDVLLHQNPTDDFYPH